MKFQLSTQVLLLVACQGLALSPQATTQSGKPHSPLGRSTSDVVASSSAVQELRHNLAPTFAAAYLLATMCTSVAPCFADEYGVEKEAPTLYTGETVEICTKRGPLGACLKTEFRTEDNDNDKAKKYFRDPAITLREKNEVLQGTAGGESNALVERLKQQTEDNKEKNRMDVERRTFENDQVCKSQSPHSETDDGLNNELILLFSSCD